MRAFAESRPNWEPPGFVVIDAATGRVVSKHKTAEAAQATADSINTPGARRRSR